MLKKTLKIIGMAIGGVAIAVVIAFIFGIAVQLLWNWLIPSIFKQPEITITFWQAWGLIILCKILFGSLNLNHDEYNEHNHRHKFDTWKDKFKKHFKEKCPHNKDDATESIEMS